TSFLPIYPLTAGISSKTIHTNIRQIINELSPIPDFLCDEIREIHHLVSIDFALRNIHFPKDNTIVDACRKRLIFDEFYLLSLVMASLKSKHIIKKTIHYLPTDLQPFFEHLPFSPTNAQRKVLNECSDDLCKSTPMNRLIQGDVGSGKTVIAAGCIYHSVKNTVQSAMMVPTEILAIQHYKTLCAMLNPHNIRVGLLTGSMPISKKNKVKKQLKNGELDFCVGTHALISEDVIFQNLGLIIADEQHRFGVLQRTALTQKGESPHILVMSATPIPRTLALMVYCDLDLSIIDELPPNRQPIETYKITSAKQSRAFAFIKEHLDRKLQAYIVCPLIEMGEIDTGLKPATDLADELATHAFSNYRIGLLHGKMKSSEKEAIMQSFQMGEIDVLVSTTVIEVGVDVPNASIIFIQNADRFGLSQLHQLRGRVGRGAEKSYCILLSDSKNTQTLERLSMLCTSNDGFEIAEYDLKTRGPGDFLGYRQHGIPFMKIADLSTDTQILNQASTLAKQTLLADPHLEKPEHALLKQ
ncbi:MAG: ATP-dependent DNA helicase RecG, partial [Oscillospiraceae bacterium]